MAAGAMVGSRQQVGGAGGRMRHLEKQMEPIVEMFRTMVASKHVFTALSNWKKTIAEGILYFGVKESLTEDLEFNALFYTNLNPQVGPAGNRLILDVEYDIVGVVTNRHYRHEHFDYLRNEMLVLTATGRWDYRTNDRFRKLVLRKGANLRVPPDIDPDPAQRYESYIQDIAKYATLWLLNRRVAARAAG